MDKDLFTGSRYKQHFQFWERFFSEYRRGFRFAQNGKSPDKGEAETGFVSFLIDRTASDNIFRLVNGNDMGVFICLLTGLGILLKKYSREKKLTVSSPTFSTASPTLPLDKIPLFIDIEEEDSLTDQLNKVKEMVKECYQYQDYPIELIDGSPTLYCSNVLIQYDKIHHVKDKIANHDLILTIETIPDQGLKLIISYNLNVFTAKFVEKLASHFQNILFYFEQLNVSIKDIDILSECEKHGLLFPFNYPGETPDLQGQHLIPLFEKQVESRAQSLAVQYQDKKLSYLQLNQLSNQVGHCLRERFGVGANTRVGIMLTRSDLLVVSVLGVLKSAGAFVALDPAYPQERKRFMLAEADVDVLITETTQFMNLTDYQGQLLVIDVEIDTLESSKENLPINYDSTDLAYVLYTSGSTGQPKGVCVEHGNLLNYLIWANQYYYGNQPGHPTALMTSLSFDLTVTSLFTPLLRGDSLYVVNEEQPVTESLKEVFSRENGLKTIKLTPSHVNLLRELNLSGTGVESIILGGEAVSREQVMLLYSLNPDMRIYNEYGPTETTVGCSVARINASEPITIGQPITNTKIYVLDELGQLMPVGVHGEICVSGRGVTRGYLNRVELTKQRFTENPYQAPGYEWLYRTGDTGYWREDGQLSFAGRKDTQVKLKGYRIELGEIEELLLSCQGIEQAAVRVVSDDSGQQELVGYYVSNLVLNPGNIRQYLSEHLPAYMVPAVCLQLQIFPLNENGKLDRGQLPLPSWETTDSSPIAPTNAIEGCLIKLWQQVLGKERVGIEDNFFALGGDSIRSIRLVADINKAFDCIIEVKDIFKYQTIASLANYLIDIDDSARNKDRETAQKEVDLIKESVLNNQSLMKKLPADWEEIYPMSDIAKGMIFHNLLSQQSGVYHDQFYHQIEDQDFDLERLQKALGLLVDKHPTLRTSFHFSEFEYPLQIVHTSLSEVDLKYEDIKQLPVDRQKIYLEEYLQIDRQNFFVVTQLSLWRLRVFRLQEFEYGILLVFHHAMLDGWSRASFMTELSNVYNDLKLYPELTLHKLKATHKDYIIDQWNCRRNSKVINYWKDKLSNFERTPLPYHKTITPHTTNFDIKSHTFTLDADLNESVYKLSESEEIPIKAICLAAFLYVIKLTTGSDDTTIGLVTHGRPEIEDGDKLAGCFLNTVPFRTKWARDLDSASLLNSIRTELDDLKGYDKLSFLEIVKISGEEPSWRNPLHDILFNYIDFYVYYATHKDIVIKEHLIDNFENTNTPFVCSVCMSDGRIIIILNYFQSLYSDEEIKKISKYFVNAIRCLTQEKNEKIAAARIIGSEEMEILAAFNNTAGDFPRDKTVHHLFEQQAALRPHAIAVCFEDKVLTYSALNAKSNQFAHYLRSEYGIGPDDLVGIAMNRSENMLVCLLGIIKAGGAYLPVELNYPEERIIYSFKNARVKMVVVDSAQLPLQLPKEGFQYFMYESDLLQGYSSRNPENINKPGDLIYALYTSGSTGQPKGVMVEHAGVVNRIHWMWNEYQYGEGDVIFQKTPYIFDVSVWELFMPVCFGAQLVLSHKEVIYDPGKIMEHICRYKITSIHFVPSMLNTFLDTFQETDRFRVKSLRHIIASGEALLAEVVKKHYQKLNIPLHNLYGPTEASVDVTYYQTKPGDTLVPIGKPISNIHLHIVDNYAHPVPVGVVGEVCISGIGLARGYLNSPELTREKFINNSLSGERMYRTGDMGRWLEDGCVDYIGRKDNQVKIRGHRIELGEIESLIQRNAGVENVYIRIDEDQPPQRALTAIFTPSLQTAYTIRKLLKLNRETPELYDKVYFLPNGLPVVPLNKSEVDFLYNEIFASHIYEQNGIKIKDGDIVFDVGANIGMFSLFAGLHKNVKVYSFEPIKPIYDILKKNVDLYNIQVIPFNIGLSSKEELQKFNYYPYNTVLSGISKSEMETQVNVRNYIVNQYKNMVISEQQLDTVLKEVLHSEEHICQTRRISDLIKEYNIEKIDLLKIDVEKSELEVIEGVEEEDWKLIKQIIIEVHDIDNRLDFIERLLQEKGFITTVQQDELLSRTDIYLIYGRKHTLQIEDSSLPCFFTEKEDFWTKPSDLIDAVRNLCRKNLPDYMVPVNFFIIDQFPLTPSGKLNKQAVNIVNGIGIVSGNGYVPANTTIESNLIKIWEEVLGREQIGIKDNFFEIGGHSLKVLQVTSRILKEINIAIDLGVIFSHPTIEQLSYYIQAVEWVNKKDLNLESAQERIII